MKKKLVFVLLAALMLCLFGCYNGGENNESSESSKTNIKEALVNRNFSFIYYEKGAFSLDIALPSGWTYGIGSNSTGELKQRFPIPLASTIIYSLYDESGEYIGAIGCGSYNTAGVDESNPVSIYEEISSSEDCRFETTLSDKGGYYNAVEENENSITATTKVYYSPAASKKAGYSNKERHNQGILSFERSLGIYTAIEFDKDAVSDEQLKSIAESVAIVPYEKPNADKPDGFILELYDGEVTFIDYGLNFKAPLPKDERFVYQFQYDDVGMNEGACYGRTTLRIYFIEEGQPMERNQIEIISTPVGTNEFENFTKTGMVTLDEAHRKRYYINESENGVKLLYEYLMDKHCIKADLTNSAYEELKSVLEKLMLETEFYDG